MRILHLHQLLLTRGGGAVAAATQLDRRGRRRRQGARLGEENIFGYGLEHLVLGERRRLVLVGHQAEARAAGYEELKVDQGRVDQAEPQRPRAERVQPRGDGHAIGWVRVLVLMLVLVETQLLKVQRIPQKRRLGTVDGGRRVPAELVGHQRVALEGLRRREVGPLRGRRLGLLDNDARHLGLVGVLPRPLTTLVRAQQPGTFIIK